ncbi:unnamed protein product [Pocillopora meandrina]|uniref:MANSC domain-containing protein n=1 Tax=Pocillopora meandrina TaxID=46732 RepID=A0AAU9Y4L5_9CNID|nr:unnamed protein product [Pocillopora meandrina]
MDECQDICCRDEKCNVAFMLGKTCYSVACKSKELCEHSKAPPTDYNPQLSYVRPMKNSDKKGSKDFCIPVSVKASKKTPLISAMLIKAEPKEEIDLSAVASSPEDSATTELASNSATCMLDSRISNDIKLRPGTKASNFTALGRADDIHRCIGRCCARPSCDIAYLLNGKCFAVQCLDGVLCQTSAEPVSEGQTSNWMIVYIIAASLAFVAGIGGVIWAVCICMKRQKLRKQRRMLDDDEDDEMLPKPTQTRYRTPMPRY